MPKKIVFLPYDMDTANGIDNYGRLRFGYGLEDIDTSGGEKVYAGQDSVLWKNVRVAFNTELTAMYRSLRSGDNPALSYDKIEQMFEDHQSVWSEATFNEDAYFKYILPLINDNENRLEMCLGSKAEQRKWWLFNRFKYIDSKYNAGDASADSVSMRTYYEPASGETFGISITPYADIYATVLYGVSPSRVRAPRNNAVLVPCTIDHLEFTDTYIYSASQIASFGDLSIFKPDAVEFSKATHVQELKFGDASASYSNPNLKTLTLGNNILLKKLDVRNCPNLANAVDLSGCVQIEEVYFDGTAIPGLALPNGAPVRILHLPSTIANLNLRNLGNLTDFTCPDFSNIATLRIENCSSVVDPLAILDDIQTNSRVRIIGFDKTVSAVSDIEEFYDQLDTMRGLDESGNTTDKAQVSGTIHISTMTGAKYSELTARYPYITLDVASVESTRTYKTWDGSSTIASVTCLNGVPQSAAPTVPARSSTAQYAYAPAGWSLNQDSYTADFDPASTTMGDTTVYAAYTRTVRTYTITWVNNGTTIETDTNVPYGATPQYNGATPTKDGQTSTGWNPTPTTVTGNATYTATYLPSYSVKFYNGSTLLYTDTVIQGGTASYSGSTPVNSEDSSLAFLGWGSSSSSTSADAVLTNIQSNKSVYAVFESSAPTATTADGAYGVEWDYSQSSPQLTRKGLAANFADPVPAESASGSGSSPFDNIQPWAGMKEVNILSDGTVIEKSDSRFSYTDNDVMVWIPEFYYTAYKDETNQKWLWAISPTAKEGFKKHPGSGRYVSKYHTSGGSDGVYSKSGANVLVNVSKMDFRLYSKNKGTGWYMLNIATWSALQLLYLIEFANFNSQTMLGYGFNTGDSSLTGHTDNSVYNTIKASGEDHNEYRWIEDPFSYVFDFVEGLIAYNKEARVSLKDATIDDVYTMYDQTNITIPSSGYVIKGFGYSEVSPWAFIPDTVRTDSDTSMYNTYVCDRLFGPGTDLLRALYVGGSNSQNDIFGFFCTRYDSAPAGAANFKGSRLIYIPQN